MIHKFSMLGTNIVVDVNSGGVHVFDNISYDILDYFEKNSLVEIINKLSPKYESSKIKEAYEEIKKLQENGLLYSVDTYKEHVPSKNEETYVKALCLHISHDCNLRCGYCFASTGDFGGERMNMSADVGKKAIDMVIKKSGNVRNIEIDFFGGEPLLNFGVVKEIVEYALHKQEEFNKNFRFTITTNGVLLSDEIIEYVNKHMDNIVLSIDGRKEVNDAVRPTAGGKGSFDNILPKFIKVAESRNQDNYYVRGTFTRKNLDFAEDVLFLADKGFKQISVEPVVAAPGSEFEIRDEDIDVVCKEYEKIAVEYHKRRKEGNGFNFFHFMVDLTQGPCIIKRLAGCGSGHQYLAITPVGDIYPCHQFVGMDEFNMGNVTTGISKPELQKEFKGCNVYSKEECEKCWAKFYCSGGCAANSYQFHKDINKTYGVGCELEKKRLECALWLKAVES